MKHWVSFRSVDAALLGDDKIPTRNQPQKVKQPKPRKAADNPTWPKTHTTRTRYKPPKATWSELGWGIAELALYLGMGICIGAVAFAALLAMCAAANLFGCALATVVPLVPNSGADIIKFLTGKSCYPWG